MNNQIREFNTKTDRELIEGMARELEFVKSEVAKLNENLIDTHELMNDISNRIINK
jgi:hypothetical protein